MPLFINNKQISIQELLEYDGTDSTKIMLKKGIKELRERFFNRGNPFILKYRKGMVKINNLGMKESKKGIRIPFLETINTPTGSNTIIYAENSSMQPGGNIIYEPRGRWYRSRIVLPEEKIEEALFLYKVSSVTSKGFTYEVYDEEVIAEEIVKTRSKNASLEFYLYNEDSPIDGDRAKLERMCHVWGVRFKEKDSDAILKNKLHDAVLTNKLPELNIDAFVKMVKEETPMTKALEVVNRALDKGNVVYSDFTYKIKGTKTAQSRKLFVVPPQEESRGKILFAENLLLNPEKYDLVKSTFYDENDLSNFDPAKINTPEQLKDLQYDLLKSVAEHNNIRSIGVKKYTIIKQLTELFEGAKVEE